MNTGVLLEKIKFQKIGQAPVVVLPIKIWHKIEDCLEELEILKSVVLQKKIAKARSEKKLHSSTQVKKLLGIT